MIAVGSQTIFCDLPVRMDNYIGCSHACKYCFANRKIDISKIKSQQSEPELKRWIKGDRNKTTAMFDYEIPLHWGGLSDPFQPLELKQGNSLKLLKIFADSQYPVVISTKGICIKESKYLDVIKNIHGVIQISMSCKEMERYETGAPTYNERLGLINILSKYIRVNIRVQPYFPQHYNSILADIKDFASNGAYGVIFESMKYLKKFDGTERLGADFVYPIRILKPMFVKLKIECHKYGLKFYSGENRLRKMSDNLCCCGIEGLGFKTHVNNLNHIFFEKGFKLDQTAKGIIQESTYKTALQNAHRKSGENALVSLHQDRTIVRSVLSSIGTSLIQRSTTKSAMNKAFTLSRLHQDTIADTIADTMSYNDFIIQLSKIRQYQDIMGVRIYAMR